MVHVELAVGTAAFLACVYLFGKVLDHADVLRKRRAALAVLSEWRISARVRQSDCRCPDAACPGTVCVRFADAPVACWHCSRCGSPCDGSAGDFFGTLRGRIAASDASFRRADVLEEIHAAVTLLEE